MFLSGPEAAIVLQAVTNGLHLLLSLVVVVLGISIVLFEGVFRGEVRSLTGLRVYGTSSFFALGTFLMLYRNSV